MTRLPNLEEPVRQGSPLLGILGASLGATAGAAFFLQLSLIVPDDWTKLAFLSGFLVGPISCLGYRLFRGLRSDRFARNTVRVCTALSPIPGLLASLVVSALQKGLPVSRLLQVVLRGLASIPEREVLTMLVGISLFFLLSTGLGRSLLLAYTDPAWYHDPRRIACSDRGGILYNDPSLWRMAVSGPVPEAFTVGRKLSVSGDTVTVHRFFREERSFSAGEIAGVIMGPTDGHNVLYDRNNEVLAKFAWSMKGAGFLMQYLLERGAPLLDVEGERIELKLSSEHRTLPKQFTVRESKVCLALGWVGTVGFGLLVLFCSLFAPPAAALIVGGFFLVLTLLFAWMLSSYYRRRLEVDGDDLSYTTSLGRTTRFHISQVEKTSVSTVLGTAKLLSSEGKVLARFENNMKDSDLLQIYLDRHLRQKEKRKE